MNRAVILDLLNQHRDEFLQRFGAKHLALFGSAARALGSHSSCFAAPRSGMAGNNGACLFHHLLVRHQFAARSFRISRDIRPHVILALLKAIAQHEPEHGLRRPSGLARKFFEPALLRLRKCKGLHAARSQDIGPGNSSTLPDANHRTGLGGPKASFSLHGFERNRANGQNSALAEAWENQACLGTTLE